MAASNMTCSSTSGAASGSGSKTPRKGVVKQTKVNKSHRCERCRQKHLICDLKRPCGNCMAAQVPCRLSQGSDHGDNEAAEGSDSPLDSDSIDAVDGSAAAAEATHDANDLPTETADHDNVLPVEAPNDVDNLPAAPQQPVDGSWALLYDQDNPVQGPIYERPVGGNFVYPEPPALALVHRPMPVSSRFTYFAADEDSFPLFAHPQGTYFNLADPAAEHEDDH